MQFFSYISLGLIIIGIPFFLSGTIGLLRFPDIYTRLHALTKADNVGIGFIILGLSFSADNILTILKLILIWILVLIASSAASHLIARSALQKSIMPWRRT